MSILHSPTSASSSPPASVRSSTSTFASRMSVTTLSSLLHRRSVPNDQSYTRSPLQKLPTLHEHDLSLPNPWTRPPRKQRLRSLLLRPREVEPTPDDELSICARTRFLLRGAQPIIYCSTFKRDRATRVWTRSVILAPPPVWECKHKRCRNSRYCVAVPAVYTEEQYVEEWDQGWESRHAFTLVRVGFVSMRNRMPGNVAEV